MTNSYIGYVQETLNYARQIDGTLNNYLPTGLQRFLLPIGLSLIASAIFAILLWVTRVIWLDKLYFHGARSYSPRTAYNVINKEFERASRIRIMTIRANSFIPHSEDDDSRKTWFFQLLNNLFGERRFKLFDIEDDNHSRDIEISFLDGGNIKATPIIEKRSKAQKIHNDKYRRNLNRNKIALIDLREETSENTTLNIFLHTSDIKFRLIIMGDHFVFVTPFLDEKGVNQSRTIRYDNKNPAFEVFINYYESLKGNTIPLANNKQTSKGDSDE